MSTQQDRSHEVATNETPRIMGIERALTPLQSHYLSQLQRLIAVKAEAQNNPDVENWQRQAINKAIYSALRDCMEANVGDLAKEMLSREHQVN